MVAWRLQQLMKKLDMLVEGMMMKVLLLQGPLGSLWGSW